MSDLSAPSAPPQVVARFLGQHDEALLASADSPAGEYSRVAAVMADAAAARGAAISPEVTSRIVGVYLASASGALPVAPRPEWPALDSVRSRPAQGGWWTLFRFAAPVPVHDVVAAVGRAGLPGVTTGPVPRAPGTGYDVRVVNPIGFEHHPSQDVVDLDPAWEVTRGLVTRLRDHAGVRVGDWTPQGEHIALGLALAGVPLMADRPGAGPVGRVAAEPVELTDPVAREEHSVLLRRAAFDLCHTGAQPSVSIVLATKRPDMLDFTLAQVARQRGVNSLELVLAPHGFSVPESEVRAHLGPDAALQILPQDEETLFGDVLQAASVAARGDMVLKMDDDDWYAPDLVADLLRAKAYSGADVVGVSAELHYLSEPDLTVKRGHPTERFVRFVAGGTTLLDRAFLAEIGGWRSVRKFVDAQLLEGVLAAGGSIYRTHGLGYILRRNTTGHTWQVDLDYLLDPQRVAATWPGFRPSRLMEADPRHLPTRIAGSAEG